MDISINEVQTVREKLQKESKNGSVNGHAAQKSGYALST